jgi:hypothetical protein
MGRCYLVFREIKFNATTCGFVLIFSLLAFIASKGWSQCTVGASHCTTYEQTLSQYSGNIDYAGTAAAPVNGNYNFSSGRMLLIPSGVNYQGNINGNNHTNVAICIAVGGALNPGSMNNFQGIIRNYDTISTLTLANVFNGSLENYGGTVVVNNTSQIYSGRHILNCSGKITWNGDMNVNNSTIYNAGQILVTGQMSSGGCLQNEAWVTIGSYYAHVNITNNGKIEIIGTSMSFNSGGGIYNGDVVNNCALYSLASGAQFQNNTSMTNNGLIYLPVGTFETKDSKVLTMGTTGVVRTRDLTNEGIIRGSGWFYVSRNSHNKNNGVFGQNSDTIQFYDATLVVGRPAGHFDIIDGGSSIGSMVKFEPFSEPQYSPELSNYACGDIILSGSVQPGIIAQNQVLCRGMNAQPFTSEVNPWSPTPGASLTYQWQISTDNSSYTNLSGANALTYAVASNPAITTYFRRRVSATYSGADSIRNSSSLSNVVWLKPVDQDPASITSNPSPVSICEGAQAQFTAGATNYNSLLWQFSTDEGLSWTSVPNVSPYSGVTQTTLTINPSPASFNNYRYRMVAIHNECGNVYSTSAILSVIADDTPVIISHPSDQIICNGTSQAQFVAQTSSSGVTYQWQMSSNNGANWNNLSNGTDYQNVTTNTLTIQNNGLINKHQFRCVITAQCNSNTSDPAILYMVIPDVEVSALSNEKCPDTDPLLGFNPMNDSYNHGNSSLTFTIDRNRVSDGPFDWEFSYQFSASDMLLVLPESQQPQPFSGTIEVEDPTTTYHITFYLENQTENNVSATLNIGNVLVEGCNEPSLNNPKHTAALQLLPMPPIGPFDTE